MPKLAHVVPSRAKTKLLWSVTDIGTYLTVPKFQIGVMLLVAIQYNEILIRCPSVPLGTYEREMLPINACTCSLNRVS